MISRLTLLGTALLLALGSPALAKDKAAKTPPVPNDISAMTVPIMDTDPEHDPGNVLLLDLSDGGRVAIRLMPQWAPSHVERIKTLTGQGFYNGVIFHRVIDGFMAQTGDPTGTGTGGSKLPDLKAEFNSMPHLRGMVSMARTNSPDSANSQFFIVFYPRFTLDHKYTVFGRVIRGMEWVDKVERGEPPTNPTRILQASLASERKPAPQVPANAAPSAPSDAPVTVDQLNAAPADAGPADAGSADGGPADPGATDPAASAVGPDAQ